jgi:hypothetical protein
VGGALFAEHTIYDQPSAKPGHEVVGDTLFSVRVDSDVMLPNGDYEHVVFDGTSPRYVAMAHSVIEWNFTVAFEYTPSSKDRLWWESVFSDASDFMYDYTDGQMQFGAIHIDYGVSTLSQEWINADITVSDGEEWPRANVGGAYIQNGKIFLGRLWQGFDVSKRFKNTFSTVVAHEANHYALKIYDEYIDANGGRTANNRSRHPGKFPLNYGVMESQWNSSELSSSNDYLAGYSGASTDRTLTTYQSWRHDLANGGPAFSCWDYLQETVFGPLLSDLSPSLHLTLPEAGEFVNGVSTTEDRPGPESGQLYAPYYVEPTITTSVGKSVGVLDKVGRTVVVGISADQPLRSQIVRITAAGVSRILGMTGFDGILDGVTLIPGDTLRVYTGNTYSAVEVTVPVGRVEVVHDSSLPLRKALGDETGLGVNVVLDVESLESGITIAGDILFESDTTETPTFTISAESGATYSGDLVSSSARKYTLSADIGESDLSGTLELYATTTAGIVETIGRYEITPAEINGVPADGKLNVNISDDSASGSTIILYRTTELEFSCDTPIWTSRGLTKVLSRSRAGLQVPRLGSRCLARNFPSKRTP